MTGQEYKKLRKYMRLTQVELASELGISVRKVRLIEAKSEVPVSDEYAMRHAFTMIAEPQAEPQNA